MYHLHPFFLHLSHLQPWIESWLSTGGPIIVFIVTFVEGIPPIGLLAPSHTIVFFAMFLAKIGALRFDTVIAVAIAGAVLGDIVGYFFGKKYGYTFLLRLGKFFSIKEESLEKVKNLVSGHLNKAVFIGKFNPLTRSLAPFVVGASKISFRRFILIDFIANVSWTMFAFVVGYVFGASYTVVAPYFGRIIIIALVIAVLVVIAYRFISRQFHIFAKYELFALILNILAICSFAAMLEGISGWHHFMLNPDIAVNIWFSNLANAMQWLVPASNFISTLLGPTVLAVIAIGLSIYFFIKKRWRHFYIILASLVGGYFLTEFIKNAIGSPRPYDALIHLSDFSFPSGHATAVAGALVLVVYFFAPSMRSKSWRWFLVVGLFILTLVVGASRLVLGVHWLSDIIAGYSLGIFWTTAMILCVRYGGLIWEAVKGFGKKEEYLK
jgi:membrane protein DedA with SNARE-associated domain/membrane-associated phospholipid phosphatase